MAAAVRSGLDEAGVRIGFGTDSGATAMRVPGFAEHRELELMVEAGLTPEQALRCATAGAAKASERSRAIVVESFIRSSRGPTVPAPIPTRPVRDKRSAPTPHRQSFASRPLLSAGPAVHDGGAFQDDQAQMIDHTAGTHSAFLPKLVTTLAEGYRPRQFRADLLAGLTVAIVALPLSMAIAIASGVEPPEVDEGVGRAGDDERGGGQLGRGRDAVVDVGEGDECLELVFGRERGEG